MKTIALSSSDSEYMALSDTSREAIFVRGLLTAVGFFLQEPTDIYGDNNASIEFAKNPCAHHKSKHLDIRLHFIRQKIEEEVVTVKKIGTQDQIADIFTKALPRAQHERLALIAMGWSEGQIE